MVYQSHDGKSHNSKGTSVRKNAKTTICCTRYGNVMASRGSVIPLGLTKLKKEKI